MRPVQSVPYSMRWQTAVSALLWYVVCWFFYPAIAFTDLIYLLFIDLVFKCEYRRQMRKRGKGSQRYATNSSAARKQSNAGSALSEKQKNSPNIDNSTLLASDASSRDNSTGIPLPTLQPPQAPLGPPVSISSPMSSTRRASTYSMNSPGNFNNGGGIHGILLPPVQKQFSPGSSADSNDSPNSHRPDSENLLHRPGPPPPPPTVATTTATASTTTTNTSTSITPHNGQQGNHFGNGSGEVSDYLLRHMQSTKESQQITPSYFDGLDELMVSDVNQIFSSNGHSVIRRSRASSVADSNSGAPASATIFVQTPGTTTPRWLNIKSPFPASLSALFATPVPGSPRAHTEEINSCVYPVLVPILGSLDFISPSLAADLLEVYFSNTIYGIGHFVRRSSILAVNHMPRQCSRALLYSFLYVAAHVSDHPHMTATPTSRTDIITRLFDLTIGHLQPLVHADKTGSIDDVMTYINLGIISSASEFKGASLRWWHAAWGLARVLKLNIEVPRLSSSSSQDASGSNSLSSKLLTSSSLSMTEEDREERRRVWWLLFLVDRHLGLCYNRPISVLDHESSALYRPCNDELWHSELDLIPAHLDSRREKGLSYRVTGKDVWGYFLPVMTLLGGVVDIHQLEMNNTLAVTREVTEPLRARLRARLEEFVKSVDEYDSAMRGATYSADGNGTDDEANRSPDSVTSAANLQQHQMQQPRLTHRTIWKEYCRCLAHVLHILVSGYWDPIEMLSLPPTMVLDPDFVNVIQHSLDFAKCTKRILEVDQDLRQIPFFFGIHMLQGSFTLLYVVDVLGDKEVRVACETIVRAHEVCIVTLNTEYQRNFRQIMRGALQMIDALEERRRHVHVPHNHLYGGSPPEEVVLSEMEDSKRRRRGLLNLYRWCRGGNGLAV